MRKLLVLIMVMFAACSITQAEITNFPEGFPYGVSLRGVPVLVGYAGEIIWIASSNREQGNDSDNGTRKKPYKTINYAMSQCVTDNGDIILAKQGYEADVSTTASIRFNVKGVKLVSLGEGTSRGILTWTQSTSASIEIDQSNCGIYNFQFKSEMDTCNSSIDVDASDFTIAGCLFEDDATHQMQHWIFCDENADDLKLFDNEVLQKTAGAKSWVWLVQQENVKIWGNDIVGDYASANIANKAVDGVVNITIDENDLENLNAINVVIELCPTASGKIKYTVARVKDNLSDVISPTGNHDCSMHKNFGTKTDGTTTKLLGVVSGG